LRARLGSCGEDGRGRFFIDARFTRKKGGERRSPVLKKTKYAGDVYRVAEHIDGLDGAQIDDRANRILNIVREHFPEAELVAIHKEGKKEKKKEDT